MKNIILLSGGLDSGSLLFYLLEGKTKADLHAIFFNYGQKSVRQERAAAKALSSRAKVEFKEIYIQDIFKNSGSSLLIHNKEDITEIKTLGRHTRFISKKTEVEFRNGVFLSCAISFAMQLYPEEEAAIYYGAAKSGADYKDCSLIFTEYYKLLSKYVSDGRIDIQAPFIDFGKDEIVRIAKKLKVPIKETWSCYGGGKKPCGICPACLDRKILGVFYDN